MKPKTLFCNNEIKNPYHKDAAFWRCLSPNFTVLLKEDGLVFRCNACKKEYTKTELLNANA